jgi:hypothetical protein
MKVVEDKAIHRTFLKVIGSIIVTPILLAIEVIFTLVRWLWILVIYGDRSILEWQGAKDICQTFKWFITGTLCIKAYEK